MTFFSIFLSMAMAALPPLPMILERTAENSPAILQYSQTLEFQPAGVVVKESWWVTSSRRMRLKAEFTVDGVTYVLNRDYGQKQSEQVYNLQKTAQRIPPQFFEHLNFLRDRGDIQQVLADWGIATSTDLTHRYSKKSPKDEFDYFPHPAMVLSRAEGVTSYLLFKGDYPKIVDKGIWIEQDKFVVRKVKMDADTILEFKKYITVGKTFYFANERRLDLTQETVHIKSSKISVPKNITFNALDSSNFNTLPDVDKTHSVLEFYRRFR
ncbi:MAG: hypothetical protein V4736_15505 [Bdellovibrionota bacterium]